MYVDLLMSRLSLPVEKLKLDHVDQQDNTALHLACLQVGVIWLP